MNLRIRSAEFDAASVSALEDSTQNAAWESLSAAQEAYDAAPHARLACDEIERLLRWQTASRSSRTQTRRRRAARALNLRLYPESLERRDVPTPVFCLTLMAAAVPSAAPWNDERICESQAGAAYVDADSDSRAQSLTDARELPERFATYSAPYTLSADACLAWSDYGFLPNDRALIELLAASVPSSRSLEPLVSCA